MKPAHMDDYLTALQREIKPLPSSPALLWSDRREQFSWGHANSAMKLKTMEQNSLESPHALRETYTRHHPIPRGHFGNLPHIPNGS